MRKRWNLILPLIVLVLVIIVVVIKRDDLGEFAATLQAVQTIPFVLAAICLFGRYFSHAFAYKGVFRCIGEEVPYMHIVPLVFSVTFANDCAPSAGVAGSVLIAAWSHKQGLDMGRSVTVVFLEKIGYFGGFAVVMLLGFLILIATGQMVWYLVLGGFCVLAMVASVLIIMILGYNHVDRVTRLFSWVERLSGRVFKLLHRKPAEPWADRVAASFHEAAVIATERPKTLITTFLRMIMLHAFDCLCFICVGLAFNFPFIPLLMASYVAGFIIATFILQTIGAVEILIALILVAYGATGAQAAAIALCYRGLIFWVPFLIGAICINITGQARQLKNGEAGKVIATGTEENAIRMELAIDSDEKKTKTKTR